MKKRILIGYAEYGSGHKSVANYVKSYFEEKGDYEILLLNLSEYSNFLGRFSHKFFYTINKSEFTFNLLYELSNNKLVGFTSIKTCLKAFDMKKLENVFREFNPDIVIASHFFVSYIAGYFNDILVTESKIFTILTDFAYHAWWTINKEQVDYFIVANDIVKNEIIEHGVLPEKIKVFGIPINRSLISKLDEKETILKRYSLTGEKPIYLFFAGGSIGYDSVFPYFVNLVKASFNIDIIFICGKNKNLKLKCDQYIKNNEIKNVIVLGFTKDVFNLLNISSVIITKPGGSTLNEIIEMKKPSILIPGMGGQEKANSKFMAKKHYSLNVRSSKGLVRKVKFCLNYPFVVNSMKNKLLKLSLLDSCEKIYELANKELSKK